MNRKTAPVLVIAIVCGLGAMLASSQMLAGRGPTRPAETQQIVLAARDLAVEEVLKPDMVKLETVAKSAVPPGAFTSFRDLADRWVQVKIFDGEPIVDRKLAPKGTPTGLVARIPKGKRAYALNVNEQSGVSGFILPDHRVDVFQVTTASNGEPGRAIPVLQDLLVLASGTNIQTTTTTDRAVQARTVTVAVTAEEASTLTMAQARGGPLSLALRAMNDHEKAAFPEPEPLPDPIPKVSLAPPAAPAPPEPKEPAKKAEPVSHDEEPAPRHVTIYRGPGKPPERIRVDQPPGDEEGGLGFPSASDLAAPPPSQTPPPAAPGQPPQ